MVRLMTWMPTVRTVLVQSTSRTENPPSAQTKVLVENRPDQGAGGEPGAQFGQEPAGALGRGRLVVDLEVVTQSAENGPE